HNRESNIGLARIGPPVRRPRRIAARQDAHRRVAPQPQRRLFAVADIEPEEESALRPVEPISAGERLFGDVAFVAVGGASLFPLPFAAPQPSPRPPPPHPRP